MSKRKKWIGILSGLGLLIILGVSVRGGDQGRNVNTITVAREDIQAKVSANGKIQAVKKVDITANTMGQVTRLAVKEGDRVKAGDFLLEIDPAQSKAMVDGREASLGASRQQLEDAKARLAQAQSDFQRADSNRKAGIIAQAEFERIQTSLQTAQAAFQSANLNIEQNKASLDQAKDSLRKTVLTAPMDGVVTAKRIEQGETAIIGMQNNPGTVLLTISDMSRVEAEMEVDEASIPHVQMGQRAEVRIDAYPNQTFDGEVTEVGGSPLVKAGQEAIKFKVKVWIKNPPSTIKPGLSSQAEIFTGRREKALAVPIQALVMKEKAAEKGKPAKDEEGVYQIEGGKAVFRGVKTGLLGELNVEVIEGVKEGQTVITGPFKVLRELNEGDVVKVTQKKDADKASGKEKR